MKCCSTKMKPAFSLCVYCGSRPGSRPEFAQAAMSVGHWIGARGGQLVYGGGRNGLMGLVAEATLNAGGRVIGVIPRALVEREWANEKCTELHVVDTMHERKRLMAEHCDAFVALPGGIGTLEEIFEAWTWRQLGYHDKPIGLLDVGGYYSKLKEFLDRSAASGFTSEKLMDLVTLGDNVESLLAALVGTASGAGVSDLTKI